MRSISVLFWLLPIWLAAAPALATQHLVSPGRDWSRLAGKVKPGDEIVLMPGRHMPASLADLTGAAGAPIVIRGFDERRPAEIAAQEYGVELIRPSFVVLRDLHILNAEKRGVLISGRRDDRSIPEAWHASVQMQRITIEATGGFEDGVACEIEGIRQCYIKDLTCRGWGDAAMDIVACSDITIERSTFEGIEGFQQTNGVRVRAGSETIFLLQCRLESILDAPLRIGGASFKSEFAGSVMAQAETQEIHEAGQVTVNRCVVRGGVCGIRFTAASRCMIQSSTFIDQDYWTFWIDDADRKDFASPSTGLQFARNLATSEGNDFESAFLVGETTPQTVAISENVWWYPQLAEVAMPVEPRYQQRVDLDPLLHADLWPQAPEAVGFGAVEPAQDAGSKRAVHDGGN